jgi:hypothetical protein
MYAYVDKQYKLQYMPTQVSDNLGSRPDKFISLLEVCGIYNLNMNASKHVCRKKNTFTD